MIAHALREDRALKAIDRAIRRDPVEDTLVEMKRQWLDPHEMARHIAGQANAARGEEIMWLIGIDQKTGEITGADSRELANLIPQIKSHFPDGVAPNMVFDRCLPVGDKTVVALFFETLDAPYVVTVKVTFDQTTGKPAGYIPKMQVPYRQHTSTNDARRQDLLRILAPVAMLPDVELIECAIAESFRSGPIIDLSANLYVTPRRARRVVIPFHKCRMSFSVLGESASFQADGITLRPSSGSSNAKSSTSEITVKHGAFLIMEGSVRGNARDFARSDLAMAIEIGCAALDLRVAMQSSLRLARPATDAVNRDSIRWEGR